jgi:cell division protein FtsZ
MTILLKVQKDYLVNITGGKDLKLFEVDEAVNKVRAEVDPDAEVNNWCYN